MRAATPKRLFLVGEQPGGRELGYCNSRRRHLLDPRRRRFVARRWLDIDLGVAVDAAAGRDQVTDDDVLLETEEVVLGPADGRVGQHPRGLLERRSRDEGLGRETRLGDAQQNRLGL